MSTINRARIALVFSMVVFGTIGLFVENITLPSGEIALYRAVLAALFIGAYLLIRGERIPLGKMKKSLPVLLLSGAAMGMNWILLFEAYHYTTVSIATLSYYFAPILVICLCPVLFHEKMTKRKWVCFVFSTLGIALITGTGDLSKGSNHLVGILFGLGAAALYATVILLNKLLKDIGGIHRTLLQFLAAIVVLAPYVACTGGFHIASLGGKGLSLLLVVGLLHTGITYCLYFSSLKELPGQEAAILSYVDPLIAVLASVFILHEPISGWQIAGGAMILGFTLLNELPAKGNR